MRSRPAIVVLLVLAACGNKAVDRVGFAVQANAICRDVAERFGRLKVSEGDPAAYYRTAQRINSEGAALLRGISVPEEMRGDVRTLAERIESAGKLFGSAARLAAEERPTRDVEDAISRVGRDFAARARRLGLTACGPGDGAATSPSPPR